MLKRTILATVVTAVCLWSVPSFAKWTKWYNLNDRQDTKEITDLINNKNRYRTIPKRVECKADGKGFWIRVDNRAVHAEGLYHLNVDLRKKVDAELEQQKKRGVTVISRSDVETKRGTVTCVVWRKPSW